MIDPNFDLPGWSTAIDPRTGRQYFINLMEKTTTWDDPRNKYRQVYGPAIPMQNLHGSPKNIQVYPTTNYPAQAFQAASYSGQSVSNASPIPSTKTSHHSQSHHVEMSSLSRSSPHTPRIGSLIKHQQMMQQQTQETSFSSPTAIETDATVAKINSMFPTASDPHIRLLLKKYLKSLFPKADEAMILDVLAMVDNNVQKASEQLIRMGYEKKEMTPAPRLSHRKKEEHQQKKEIIQPTPPPKPKTAEEKKKLKARLQSQYKDIPEKIIAMALESVEHSEEKALRILDIVVQEDKDTKKKSSEKDKKKAGEAIEKIVSFKEPSKSTDLDKAAAIENDETMIINSDHTIITTPVESPQNDVGDGHTQKDTNLLQAESDETPTSDTSNSDPAAGHKKHRQKSTSMRQSKSSSEGPKKAEKSSESVPRKSILIERKDNKFMSIFTRTMAQGPSMNLAKGPKDELLLTDYVTWNGANPDIALGHKIKTNGPNSSLRIDRTYTPRGRKSELCKGPQVGLSKGSMYSQMSRPNVACN